MIPLRVNYFLLKYQKYVWYQDYISLVDHRLVGPFQFGVTGRKKLKFSNTIKEKQWKELEKLIINTEVNISNAKEVVPLGWQ